MCVFLSDNGGPLISNRFCFILELDFFCIGFSELNVGWVVFSFYFEGDLGFVVCF